MTILQILNEVAATTSRIEKESILKKYAESEYGNLLRSVIQYAYSKNYIYGVRNIEKPESYSGLNGLPICFILLHRLMMREITGNAAIQAIKDVASTMIKDDAEVFFMILQRDLRCGCAESTFNKVFKNVIVSPPYMRCTSFSKKALKKIKFPCRSEVKADGMYTDIIVTSTDVIYRSRNGDVKPLGIDWFDDYLMDVAKEMGSFVLMGEALVLAEAGTVMSRTDGNGYLNSDSVDPERVVFDVWDCVPYTDYLVGKSPRKRSVRLSDLQQVISKATTLSKHPRLSQVPQMQCNSVEDVITHFKEVISLGLEGTVLKNEGAIWKDGTSSDQVKLKIEVECELVVVGIVEGEGKYKNSTGSLICETSCGELVVGVSGMSDAQRKDFWLDKDKIVGKIVTVRFNDILYSEKNGKHSLFLPRLVEVRTDKTEADSLIRVKEQLVSVDEIIKTMFDGV